MLEVSVAQVGSVSFDEELTRRHEVERAFFVHLDQVSISVGVAIGVAGALSAVLFEETAREWEKPPIFSNDTNHPSDHWTGANHRYVFGHDLLNPTQRLRVGMVSATSACRIR